MTEFNNLRNRVAVIGVGTTAYGSFPETDEYGLAAEAFRNALADYSLDKGKIDGLLTCRIPSYSRVGEILGLDPRWTITLARARPNVRDRPHRSDDCSRHRAKRTMSHCFTPTLADRVASSTGAMNRPDFGIRGDLRLPAPPMR